LDQSPCLPEVPNSDSGSVYLTRASGGDASKTALPVQHTPGPWHAPGLCEVHAPDHRLICDTGPNNNDPEDEFPAAVCGANARRIVQCVNAHDAMLAALRDVVDALDCRRAGMINAFEDGYVERARAAIALATGSDSSTSEGR
jgi:hypothetical protein